MKRILAFLLLLWMMCGFAACGKQDTKLVGIYHATITVKDYGEIKLELDGNTAPISVGNFVKLAREGFYNGLTFHRMIPGFMIQGGDPKGDGTGNAGYTITGEFSQNGIQNPISHKRGVISMARGTKNDTASCQFFIVHQDHADLDGKYAAFGHVTAGMEVVDALCRETITVGKNGMIPTQYQPVITSIVIEETE